MIAAVQTQSERQCSSLGMYREKLSAWCSREVGTTAIGSLDRQTRYGHSLQNFKQGGYISDPSSPSV